MGYRVVGSDISDSMLRVARRTVGKNKLRIGLKKVDFQNLPKVFEPQFNAVVCLGNAINEEGVDPVKALCSMTQVLNPNGIIIFDQGQTDAIMKNPPAFVPVVNNSCLSRLFTMKYDKDVMTVDIFDFVHDDTKGQFDFVHSQINIRIRLLSEWKAVLAKADLDADYYGSWAGERYDKKSSKRLIVVAAPR